MINAHAALRTARALVETDARRRVHLRRGVSTAYYALFYALSHESARLVFGASNAARPRRQALARALTHTEMNAACGAFSARNLPDILAAARPRQGPLDATVAQVAEQFLILQRARHRADYDHTARLSRREALLAIETAHNAIGALPALRRTVDGQLFFLSLLLFKKLSGRA